MERLKDQLPTNSVQESKLQSVDVPTDWRDDFRKLFDVATGRYQSGRHGTSEIFEMEEAAFLASIGAHPSEIYDFVEDWCETGEPSVETILAITAVRYEYFVKEQSRRSSGRPRMAESFPSGGLNLGGIRWLPRIIEKARAKLTGELPPTLMYGCGMDRPFLKKVGIAPEDFLKTVWEAGSDDHAILTRVQEAAGQSKGA